MDFDYAADVSDRIRLAVKGGYDSADRIIEDITELIEYDPDAAAYVASLAQPVREQVTRLVREALRDHEVREAAFPTETDCDRLSAVFASLRSSGILAGEDVGVTMSDVRDDMWQSVVDARAHGQHVRGWVAFHRQDVDRVIDSGTLCLAFAAATDIDADFVGVGREVANAFRTAGFKVVWDDDPKRRIELRDVDWKRRRRPVPVEQFQRMRRFEFVGDGSEKFWEISTSGNTVTVRFGRIGTQGRTQTKSLASDAEAVAHQDKLVAEKTKKGYIEVDAARSVGQASRPGKRSTSNKPATRGKKAADELTTLELPPQEIDFSNGREWRMVRPQWLYEWITTGSMPVPTESEPTKAFPLRTVAIGDLSLPDGLLVACDPFIADEHAAPFVQRLPASDHRVAVTRATVGENHDRNAAAILLTGNPGPVTRWEMALVAGQDPATLTDPTGFFGYGVDCGTGIFASPQGQAAATAALVADAGMLDIALATATLDSPLHAVVVPAGESEPKIAMFESGWGDGLYPTWLGYDSAGEVVLAVTDFLLAEDPYMDHAKTTQESLASQGQAIPAPGKPTPASKGLLGRLRRKR